MIDVKRKHPLANCESCPLYKEDCAPTTGPADAKVAFVSRSPGYHDAIAHRPFAGPSGGVLDYLLKLYGTERKDILTTNVVLCKTDEPPDAAIEACRPRLESELASCELVIAGGVEAISELVPGRWSVTSARGRGHTRTSVTGLSQRVVATSNPAVVLRDSSNFPDLVRDFRLALKPLPEAEVPEVTIYYEWQRAVEYLTWLLNDYKGIVASDLETFRFSKRVACAGFATDTDMAHVLDYEVWHRPEVLVLCKQLYESTTHEWLWHNGKYDVRFLREVHQINARVDHDTFLLSYACDERPGGDYTGDQGAGLHALTSILIEDYGWPDYEYEAGNVVPHFKKTEELHDPDALYKYNGLDTVGCLVVLPDLTQKAQEDNVYDRPYRGTYIPLANALISVEMRGFGFDVEGAADLNEKHVLPKLAELTSEMRNISGLGLLNPRSPIQIKAVVYDRWGLVHHLRDTRKKVKTGSVDADVRREIIEGRFSCKGQYKNDMLAFVKAYDVFQKIDKQRGNYIEGLIKRIQPDGKLYSTFKFGTVTGRTSSENPNFQNITRSGAHGIPSIRTLFVPSSNCRIIQADYSQAELRTVAKLSGSDGLLAIYRDSTRSLHKERALAFYGEGYDKEQYTKAKNMNFGITYGQSAFTFSQLYEIPEDEAQKYIDAWWHDFPEIAEWVKTVQVQAQKEGEIVSPFGHKRRFHLITRENKDDVFREAVNFLPQNIAGVLTEHALVDLNDMGVPIVNTVHDSIVADVPIVEVAEVSRLMKEVMEKKAIELLEWEPEDIPFVVDISVGDNWASVEEIEMEVAV